MTTELPADSERGWSSRHGTTKINPLALARLTYVLIADNKRMVLAFLAAYVLIHTLVLMVPVPLYYPLHKIVVALLIAPPTILLCQAFLALGGTHGTLQLPDDLGQKTIRFALSLFAVNILYFLVYTPLSKGVAVLAGMAGNAESGQMQFHVLVLNFAIFSLYYFCIGRASLVFPAIVAGQAKPLGSVWQRGRGNSWRIPLGVGLALLPVFVVVYGFFMGPAGAQLVFWIHGLRLPSWLQNMYMSAIGAIAEGLIFTPVMAGLCGAYRMLAPLDEKNQAQDESAPA